MFVSNNKFQYINFIANSYIFAFGPGNLLLRSSSYHSLSLLSYYPHFILNIFLPLFYFFFSQEFFSMY